jgi:hypothetical protein
MIRLDALRQRWRAAPYFLAVSSRLRRIAQPGRLQPSLPRDTRRGRSAWTTFAAPGRSSGSISAASNSRHDSNHREDIRPAHGRYGLFHSFQLQQHRSRGTRAQRFIAAGADSAQHDVDCGASANVQFRFRYDGVGQAMPNAIVAMLRVWARNASAAWIDYRPLMNGPGSAFAAWRILRSPVAFELFADTASELTHPCCCRIPTSSWRTRPRPR